MDSSTNEQDDRTHRRRLLKRRIGLVVVIAFLVGGYFIFSARMPKDVTIVFEVPAKLHAPTGPFRRDELTTIDGALLDSNGQQVATFSIPTPHGLESPLSAPIGLKVKKGLYKVEVNARASLGRAAALQGTVTIDADAELRVDLRTAE